MQADISIEGSGFFQINGLTDAGRDWLSENVPDARDCVDVAHSDDQRMTEDIAEGATGDGLIVSVNGFQYLPGGTRGEEMRPD